MHIHPFLFFVPLILHRVTGRLGSIPGDSGNEAGDNLDVVQHNTWHNLTMSHTHTYTDNLEMPIRLQLIVLDWKRKPE